MKQTHYKYDIKKDVEMAISRSGVDIEMLRGKRILVTGGTGFFGVWLLSSLLEIKNKLGGELSVLALSRSPERFLEAHWDRGFSEHITFLLGDVKTFSLNDRSITHLIHMAATNAAETFAGEDQLNKLDMLYKGTRNVLEQCGTSLESVLFTSSGVAYGVNHDESLREDSFSCPNTTDEGSALGLGKLVAEYLIAYYAKKFGFSYVIARCFAFAGPYLPLDLHYAFGNFVRNAMNGECIHVKGDGQDLRSYLYIGDAIAWLLRLLVCPRNGIYNVGSGQPITIAELASRIAAQSTKNLDVVIDGEANATGNFRRMSYVPSTEKILSDYRGLEEWTSVEEIINSMLAVSRTVV